MYDVLSTKTEAEILDAMHAQRPLFMPATTKRFLPGDPIFVKAYDDRIFLGTVQENRFTDAQNGLDELAILF